MTPILLLAGGRSSRMRGIDKLAEPVGGVPLLRRQAMAAREVSDAVLVALPVGHPRAMLLHGLDVTPLPLAEAEEGLSGTLRAGVAALPDCARFLVLLADLPEIGADDIRIVLQAAEEEPDFLIWRGATADGAPGHPILFHADLRPEFAELAGDSGGEAIVKRHRSRTRLVPLSGGRARHDLDTPEDWVAWRRESGL